MSEELAIDVRGLTKRFGSKTAVDDLTFTIQPGNNGGAIDISGQTLITVVVSRTMPPQSGFGGGRPSPRKPSTPIVMIV